MPYRLTATRLAGPPLVEIHARLEDALAAGSALVASENALWPRPWRVEVHGARATRAVFVVGVGLSATQADWIAKREAMLAKNGLRGLVVEWVEDDDDA